MEITYILVTTTVAKEQQAAELAHSIMGAELAACVAMQAIRSVYRWKGEVCDEPEWRLTIKTTEQKYPDLEQHIKGHHAYEMPEIVKLQISGGSREYLAWIGQSVE